MSLLLLLNNTTTVLVAPAVHSPVVPGPTITQAGAPESTAGISVGVFDRDDPTSALVAELSDDSGREWRDPLNDAGTGKVDLVRGDAQLASIPYGSVLRFSIDGTARFAALVERRMSRTIDQGEEAAEVVELGGRGTLALLEEAVVFPERGVDVSPFADQRRFDYTSRDFDDSGWTPAYQVKIQGDEDDPYPKAPQDWPDPFAYWVWGAPIATPQTVGDCYFRRFFTLLEETTVRIFATADDGIEVYVDGVQIMAETRAFLWGETKYADVFLTADEHLIAVKATNVDRPNNPSTNVAAFIFSMVELTDGGQSFGDVLVRSDSNWVCVGYPTSPPGMTIGEMLILLIDEAQARLVLQSLSVDFTALTDSGGEPWPSAPDLAFDVGKDYLSVVREIAETYCDVKMAVGSHVLSAWAARGDTKAVTLTEGANLTELSHEGSA